MTAVQAHRANAAAKTAHRLSLIHISSALSPVSRALMPFRLPLQPPTTVTVSYTHLDVYKRQVFITGAQSGMKDIGGRSLVFLMLSGLATGASWLCYYKALQVGQVAKVVTIDKFSLILTFLLAALFLGEKLTLKTLLGGVLITVGTLVVAL